MKRLLIFMIMVTAQALCFGQGSAVVTFTGRDANNHYVRPDSIVVENLTQQWTETMYWPDTILTLNVGTGIGNPARAGGIRVSPNPFDGTAQVEVPVSEAGEVQVQVTDMLGRVCAQYGGRLPAGTHLFRIALEHPQVYVLTVWTARQRQSAKLENAGRGACDGIVYAGAADNVPGMLKLTPARPFYLGDEMRYSGYAGPQRSQTVTRHQSADETVQLVFIQDGSPCPGAPTVTDIDGNVYNTVHIGDQCWMRENLRVTRYENGDSIAFVPHSELSATVPYRYAPDQDTLNVPLFGYLYNRPAAVHGDFFSNSIPSNVQGVCPSGWHLPSQMEFVLLAEYVSNQRRYWCDGVFNNIAKAVCDTVGWISPPNTTCSCCPGFDLTTNNATGFSASPAGWSGYDIYPLFNRIACFWSSSRVNDTYSFLYIERSHSTINPLNPGDPKRGTSIRCLKD